MPDIAVHRVALVLQALPAVWTPGCVRESVVGVASPIRTRVGEPARRSWHAVAKRTPMASSRGVRARSLLGRVMDTSHWMLGDIDGLGFDDFIVQTTFVFDPNKPDSVGETRANLCSACSHPRQALPSSVPGDSAVRVIIYGGPRA